MMKQPIIIMFAILLIGFSLIISSNGISDSANQKGSIAYKIKHADTIVKDIFNEGML